MFSYGAASRSSGRCPICKGSGQVTQGGATRASSPVSYRCTHRQGTGWCPTCQGSGYTPSGDGPCLPAIGDDIAPKLVDRAR